MYSEDPTSCVEEEEKERRGEGTRFGRRKNVGKYEAEGGGWKGAVGIEDGR